MELPCTTICWKTAQDSEDICEDCEKEISELIVQLRKSKAGVKMNDPDDNFSITEDGICCPRCKGVDSFRTIRVKTIPPEYKVSRYCVECGYIEGNK